MKTVYTWNGTSRSSIAALLGLAAMSCTPAVEKLSEPLSGNALFADVVRYADFGVHRTATEGDLKTSAWIADSLREAGYDTKLQEWPLRQFFLEECSLKVEEKEVESFPFWYPKSTGDDAITAPVALLREDAEANSLKGRIALLSRQIDGINIWTAGVNPLVERAVNAGAIALIVVANHPSGELVAINARDPLHQKTCPIPAVIVAPRDEQLLLRAAQSGTELSLKIRGRDDKEARANNVIGKIDRGGKWIVVTTPSSGWFRCSGERAPGVALLLGLARWAADRDSNLSYMFIANSGHELDNIGAHYSLDVHAPAVSDVVCWIHLGASIATRKWEPSGDSFIPLPEANDAGHIVGTDDLLPLMLTAFEGVPGPIPRTGQPILGELRHFIGAGYRSFGFFGGHRFFHTKKDTPETTGPELLEPVGAALVKMLEAFEAEHASIQASSNGK